MSAVSSPGSADSGLSMCSNDNNHMRIDLFDFMMNDTTDRLLARELVSLAGPVDLASLSLTGEGLEATITLGPGAAHSPAGACIDPLFYSSDSSSETDDPLFGRTPSLLHRDVAGLKRDHFLFDASAADTRTTTPRPYSKVAAFHAPSAGARLLRKDTKRESQPRPQHAVASSSSTTSGANRKASKTGSASSAFTKALFPQVDKPSLGDLNGKMPRPVIVNSTPRRRRRTENVSREEMEQEEEKRKIKSVQSARDCRRRKKLYIQGLQQAIKQYDDREAKARQVIQTLRASIARLRKAVDVK